MAKSIAKFLLITCNIAVALFFIIGCYGSNFNSGKYWFLGLFTLASLYFLFVLIVFIVFWLLIKPKYVLIGIIALASCWLPLKNLIGIHSLNEFVVKKDSSVIRVMTWNVELFNLLNYKTTPGKKMEMIDLVKELKPDIFCIQEMAAGDKSHKAINYMPDIMKKMGKLNYSYYYNPAHDFDRDHHFGLVIASRYPILKEESVSFNRMNYNATFIYADILKGEDTFRVFNIHLQTLRFDENNRKYLENFSLDDDTYLENSKSILSKYKKGLIERHRQSDFVKKHLDESPYPVILCGDFNDVPNSYAYHTIGENLKNAFTEKGVAIGATFNGISPTLRIDNIFCTPTFEVKQYDRFKNKLSDHFPIVADLTYSRNP